MTRLHKITAVASYWSAIPLIALGLVFSSLPIVGDWKRVDWIGLLYGIAFLMGGILELRSATWLWNSLKKGGILGIVLSAAACLMLFLNQLFEGFELEMLMLTAVNIIIMALISAGWRQLE